MNGVFLQRGRAGRPGRPRDRRQAARPAGGRARPSTPRTSSARSPRPTPTARSSKELKRYADEHEREHGRFPKTLIFAANDLPHTLPRRPAGRAGARHLRPRRGLRRQDHRPGRPAAAAHPRVPQPPQPRHRGDRRPADDRRRHPGPGVHRLPAAGQVAHPVRADARPRHAQGRASTRTRTTSSSSTASTARCSQYFRNTTGMTVEPPEGDGKTIGADHRGDLAEPGPRLQHPRASSSACSASTSR